MAKNIISVMEIQPRTECPQQEAISYTHSFKNCIQQIAAAHTIQRKSFDDYLNESLPAPRQPSRWVAHSIAKKNNNLHIWSRGWAWIKSKRKGDLSYQKYKAKKDQMESEAEDIYWQDCARYNRELTVYEENRSRLTMAFRNNDKDLIEAYFVYVLTSDHFSIDYFNEYSIAVHSLQYDQDERVLMVEYRIPAKGEILPLDYFFFDEKCQVIQDKQLAPSIAADFCNDIARRVLLRAAANLFMSDELSMIDTIELHGYLDDSSTEGRIITVISLVIPRTEIIGKSPDFISTKYDFIERFREEHSPGLYLVESYQLRELLIKPRSPKRSFKPTNKTNARTTNASRRK